MLRATFIHVPRIGATKERSLWRRGYLDWRDVIDGDRPEAWSPERWDDLCAHLDRSEQALAARDALFFEKGMHAAETWRLYDQFGARAAFVDIETTGYGGMHSPITVVGAWDGGKVHQFIEGINLDAFTSFIEPFELLVTYNGKCFDLPIMRNRFPGARLERKGHIDLRYVFAKLGFKGGLKGIEKQLGIARPDDLAGMDGYAAVICWQRYQRGYAEYLDILCRYNAEDVKNLEPLTAMACAMARQKLVHGTPLVPGDDAAAVDGGAVPPRGGDNGDREA